MARGIIDHRTVLSIITMSERQAEADVGTTDAATAEETSIGLEENIAGALSYISIIGLVFFIIEDESEFVRFHAAQSVIFSVAIIVVSIIVSVVGTILTVALSVGPFGVSIVGLLVSLLLGLIWLVILVGGFVAWIYLLIRAYQGRTPHLPILGRFADKLV